MAALLRDGARRVVGGSVFQRTRAPAAAQERRLLSTQPARPGPHEDLQASLREIQEKKERLYHLLSLTDGTSDHRSYKDTQLLKLLSAQVKPRLYDSQWWRMRRTKWSNDASDAFIFVLTCMLGYGYLSKWAGGKEVAQTGKKQEQ